MHIPLARQVIPVGHPEAPVSIPRLPPRAPGGVVPMQLLLVMQPGRQANVVWLQTGIAVPKSELAKQATQV
jgi:hypothetical protein